MHHHLTRKAKYLENKNGDFVTKYPLNQCSRFHTQHNYIPALCVCFFSDKQNCKRKYQSEMSLRNNVYLRCIIYTGDYYLAFITGPTFVS